jgi:hypothetical protein
MTDISEDRQPMPEPDSKGELLLRDQIKAAMEETRAKEAPSEEGPNETARPEGSRDAAGRSEKPESVPQGAQKEPEAATLPVKPPARWSQASKTKFGALDRDLQQEILRREGEMERATANVDEERALGRQVRALAAPYEAILRAENATPVLAFRDYLNTAHRLRTASPEHKTAMLLQLARQFNVPLPQANGQAQTTPAFDPRALAPMIRDSVNAEFSQRIERQGIALARGEIDAFASDSAHPHLDDVAGVMAGLLDAGRADSLEDAYEQACWSIPEIRSSLIAQVEQKRAAEQKARTAAAKRASGSITGAPGHAGPANGAGVERSLRDELRANLRAAQGRI